MRKEDYVRIIPEGAITEPKYFTGIIKEYECFGARVVRVKDNSPVGIVRQAKKEYRQALKSGIEKQYVHIWVVFDRDGHANLKQAIQDARANNIHVAFSSVCFEYFIILHYEKCTRPFENCDAVIKYLKHKYNTDYTKKADHYDVLKDQLQTAVDNNHWLLTKHLEYEDKEGTAIADRNPYTDAYQLLKFLTGLKDPAERRAEAQKLLAQNAANALPFAEEE